MTGGLEARMTKGETMETQNTAAKPPKKSFFASLRWYEHLFAAWPLALMFLGGAIGGGCGGGAAYGLSIQVFNSQLPGPLKYLFSFLIGVGGVVLYFVLAAVLFLVFPGLAQR